MSVQSKPLTLPPPNLGGMFNQTRPSKFGKYKVVRILGKGGFGSVFQVEHGEKMFVLKVSVSIYARYLELEYNIGRTILHPYFVPALDLFEVGEFTCLLFEYVPGQTLTDFMRTPRSMNVKKLIVYQLAFAIGYLHSERKIAHIDLKPDNILIVISPEGLLQVKIIDLGLACPFAMFRPGAVGTREYMAPEVSLGFSFNEKADIWSLGMIISFIMTGKVNPVTGTHPRNMVPFQVCTLMQPPIPEQMYSDPEMAWALQFSRACLAIDPGTRASAMGLLKIYSSQKID
jgi:eukaryotic-like serine/threonine-protein kinase